VALAQSLRNTGFPCLGIASSDVDLLSPTASVELASILQPNDAIIMAAALTPEKGRDAGTLIKNVAMAQAVLAAVTTSQCSHLVYLSSDAVYDGKSTLINERTPAAPSDLYGLMHRCRELMFQEAADRLKVPLAVLRPCAIYGKGDTHNSYGPNRFLRSALADSTIRLFGAGEEIRDHVFIGDVVAWIRQVLAYRWSGTLNLVSGSGVSFADVAKEIGRLVSTPLRIEEVPRSGPVTHRCFDNSALVRTFPTLQATPLAAGLVSMLT
jgi:UDP-glucose 4-epimerase